MVKRTFLISLCFGYAISILALALCCRENTVSNPSIVVFPAQVIQGEPLMVQMAGVESRTTITAIVFNNATSTVFIYQNKPTALFGIDLHQKPGTYQVKVVFSDGHMMTQKISVGMRAVNVAPLGIPQSLGGNTTASQTQMVATLNAENQTLLHIPTARTALWSAVFIPPLTSLTVTDPYGYSRQTGVYVIPHKGVDYRASVGTPVMVINDGIVRVARTYQDYGQTVVIDHGLGVMSFYLHLSRIGVRVGQKVTRGQVIALSGQTGYALGPHLHLSIRIGGISVDPVTFFALFK